MKLQGKLSSNRQREDVVRRGTNAEARNVDVCLGAPLLVSVRGFIVYKHVNTICILQIVLSEGVIALALLMVVSR